MNPLIKEAKNIIFDLGAVIINITPEAVVNAFKSAYKGDFETTYKELVATGIFEDYEIEKVNSTQFLAAIYHALDGQISLQEIEVIWNKMLLDIPPKRIKILQEQKQLKNSYLCSNTNEIHIDVINQYIKEEFNVDGLAPLFHQVYLSYKLGIRKPNPAIFELILNEHQLIPSETVFIDDSAEHIATANKLGIQTIHLTGDLTLEKIFNA
ncbi:HAD family hydrolase [Acidiluteibacter ferrifornacis]|uniref:HAD-IA family hydrolase n=1 Tax=Acidiluteibacter ferrifornacis TaxID=2692424 RepID=A0A6N9ND79_9FLAO|nr:HAD family phosphatase [Acidiluteibacter ferrifornacis]NBG64528.1 HAD-IA family hydrolase [Acidiluteibacter ferrifornacis]